ncbi:MAG: ABC transporter substrate-binding protein [Alloprevotella sp.]|nr:ABC transporter substrate-binding protein [Alloprevotella sp.]
MRLARILCLLIVLCNPLFYGCKNAQKSAVSSADTDSLHYATLLQIERHENYTVCRIADAWHKGQTLHSYILLPDSATLPANAPDGTVVHVPLRRAVAGSSVHAALLYELGVQAQLLGVCDADFTVRKDLRQALQDGSLQDMGPSMQPNTELLLQKNVDALLISPYKNAQYGPIAHCGIPLIECADYMEATALGRAEWIKFYGLLFGCAQRADSLFSEIERDYKDLCKLAKEGTHRPTVLVDCQIGGTWYVPGGKSTIGTLLADAGGQYIFADNTDCGSLPYNFEKVFARGADAEVWIIRYGSASNLTRQQLAQDFSPNKALKAWKTGNIYLCNVSKTPYYEDTPFFPNRQLRDFVQLFHPELFPKTDLRFYEKME